ncbi:hypothetical protein ACWCXB_10975 [Streptomyces sp. NPDC001514]
MTGEHAKDGPADLVVEGGTALVHAEDGGMSRLPDGPTAQVEDQARPTC